MKNWKDEPTVSVPLRLSNDRIKLIGDDMRIEAGKIGRILTWADSEYLVKFVVNKLKVLATEREVNRVQI